MYSLVYSSRASKKLKTLHPKDQKKIVSKLKLLAISPKNTSLHIKKLVEAGRSLRLRVGKIRAIFVIDHGQKKIYILDVDYRGNIY